MGTYRIDDGVCFHFGSPLLAFFTIFLELQFNSSVRINIPCIQHTHPTIALYFHQTRSHRFIPTVAFQPHSVCLMPFCPNLTIRTIFAIPLDPILIPDATPYLQNPSGSVPTTHCLRTYFTHTLQLLQLTIYTFLSLLSLHSTYLHCDFFCSLPFYVFIPFYTFIFTVHSSSAIGFFAVNLSSSLDPLWFPWHRRSCVLSCSSLECEFEFNSPTPSLRRTLSHTGFCDDDDDNHCF